MIHKSKSKLFFIPKCQNAISQKHSENEKRLKFSKKKIITKYQ